MATINFDALYSRSYSKVLKYVSYRVSSYEVARDIVSDIFVKVYEKQGSFNGTLAGENTWMWTVAKNTLIDYFRLKKLNEIQISKLVSEDGDQIDFAGGVDTFREVAAQDQLSLIMEAIAELPAAYQEIAQLSLVQDMKLAEVAEETGKPLNTIKVMVMRTKEMLARKLDYLA